MSSGIGEAIDGLDKLYDEVLEEVDIGAVNAAKSKLIEFIAALKSFISQADEADYVELWDAELLKTNILRRICKYDTYNQLREELNAISFD